MNCDALPARGQASLPSAYPLIWRVHFYAGLLSIPFILGLAISGCIYLFKPQIDAYVEALPTVTTLPRETLAIKEQIERARETHPGSEFVSYQFPRSEQSAAVVSLRDKQSHHRVYLNPYTLEILKTVEQDAQFIQMVKDFHGELLLGTPGSLLIELVGSWAIVLVLTGLYLWSPRRPGKLMERFKVRRAHTGRLVWKDLHRTIGIFASIGILLLLLTGLPWTTVWGGAFKEIRSLSGHTDTVDWSTRAQADKTGAVKELPSLSPAVGETVARLNLAPPVELTVKEGRTNQWSAQSSHQDRRLRASVVIHGTSGELLQRSDFSDKPMVDRVIGLGISFHEGHLFGWANQLLGLMIAFSSIGLALTGYIMWLRKRPDPRTATQLEKPGRVGQSVAVLVGIALPLVGLSLLVLLIFEKWVLKRFTSVRAWLGMA